MARRGIAVVAAFALALGLSAHQAASAASSDQQVPAVSNAREIDPADLPRGPDAAIDYLQDGVLHTAEGETIEVPISHQDDLLALLGRSGTGWLVAWGTGFNEDTGAHRFGVSRVQAGRGPQVLPGFRDRGGFSTSWRLDRDGRMVLVNHYDVGIMSSARTASGKLIASRPGSRAFSGLDVADGHVIQTNERDLVFDWQPRKQGRTRIASDAVYADVRRDLLFVRVGKRAVGPTTVSAARAPRWRAAIVPMDVSPQSRRVVGLNARLPEGRVVLQVRAMSDGALLDAVTFGDEASFAGYSYLGAPEQTVRWESETTFLAQVELADGSVLVRCYVADRCERASEIGGNITTAYEHFQWY